MEFESPNTPTLQSTDLELSLDDLDAMLEIDVLATVPPIINNP